MKIIKSYEILNIQADHVIEAWRPDSFADDLKNMTCEIIDFAVPGDSSIQ